MKIIAGIEKDYDGDRKISNNFRIGYLSQEVILDDSLTVREVFILLFSNVVPSKAFALLR